MRVIAFNDSMTQSPNDPIPTHSIYKYFPTKDRIELLQGLASGFSGGDDGYAALQHSDFFDPWWSPAQELPGSGITALTGLSQLTQLVVPDLYLPTAWSPPDALPATDTTRAGAVFALCVELQIGRASCRERVSSPV